MPYLTSGKSCDHADFIITVCVLTPHMNEELFACGNGSVCKAYGQAVGRFVGIKERRVAPSVACHYIFQYNRACLKAKRRHIPFVLSQRSYFVLRVDVYVDRFAGVGFGRAVTKGCHRVVEGFYPTEVTKLYLRQVCNINS